MAGEEESGDTGLMVAGGRLVGDGSSKGGGLGWMMLEIKDNVIEIFLVISNSTVDLLDVNVGNWECDCDLSEKTTLFNPFDYTRNIQRFESMNWVQRKIYLYNVTFGLYMLDWWERCLFNILVVVLMWFICYNGVRSASELCKSEKFVSYEDLFYLMIKPHDLEVSILALVGTQVGACIAAALGIIIMGSEDKYDSIS
ncbi:hypothetical protein RHSIM_Rhsim08G0113100 [Rhododendron simsii]|uniref:Uncharacterized protein n=1 Tax=Rhododendron simsii TaxID=118357 RepID=A0A834GMP6_RHOSS|nr:hypothetical protein RHSIM_Rhsim08G0113100 [Rhododendron simsii]